MIKTLTGQGNSAALIFDKALMDLPGIDMQTPLKLTVNGRQLVIEAVSAKQREVKVSGSIDKILSRHEKAFRKLS